MPFDWGAIRKAFFEPEKVLDAKRKIVRKAFSKQGAYIRQRAKTSIRKKKGTAPPGQPPHSHSGELRLIFFAWDDKTESLVVGPVAFNGRRGPGVVPHLLEQGGTSTDRKGRRTFYAGNPFMGPAEKAERPKFADAFKGR